MDLKQALGAFRKGLDTALEKGLEGAAQVAAVVADEAPGLFSQSKVLRDYKLGEPVATCGPGDLWAIYAGTSKKQGGHTRDPRVSIWILDKKRVQEANKQNAKPKCFDLLFEQQKRSCQHMTRIKHPGVVKVMEALEDTQQQMVLVTEPIFGSVRNVLTKFSAVPGATAEAKAVSMSPLELKMGLVRVTDTLSFLHSEAGLAHCGLTPGTILITAAGAWKLAGFGWSVATDYAVPVGGTAGQYSYNDPFPPMWDELAKPALSYAAPELVGGWGGTQGMVGASVTPAADVFSLACVVYELLAGGTQLLPVRSSLHDYRSKVQALAGAQSGVKDELTAVPGQLQGVLRSMLSPTPTARPAVVALSSCGYFQEDVLLRALRFLEGVLQREHAQKVAFIKDLSHFYAQYDDRVLQLLVLPPLIQELRDPLIQPSLLPLVLSMLERCSPSHFMTNLLPALQPVLDAAQGEVLGALVGASGVLASLMTQEAAGRCLIPLFSRSLECEGQPQVQETCLRMLQGSMHQLDYSLLKTQILPRVHACCMRTTAAAVRVGALALMTRAVARMDKEEAANMIDTAAQVVSVDRSASTLVCVSQLCDAISSQHGAEVTATRLMPLLCPLMVAPALGAKQFRELHGVLQAMLERVQAKVLPGGGGAGAAHHTAQDNATGSTGQASAASWDTPLDPPSSYRKRGQQQPQAAPPSTSPSLSPTHWMASSTSTTTTSTTAPAASSSWLAASSTPATTAPAAASSTAWGSTPAATTTTSSPAAAAAWSTPAATTTSPSYGMAGGSHSSHQSALGGSMMGGIGGGAGMTGRLSNGPSGVGMSAGGAAAAGSGGGWAGTQAGGWDGGLGHTSGSNGVTPAIGGGGLGGAQWAAPNRAVGAGTGGLGGTGQWLNGGVLGGAAPAGPSAGDDDMFGGLAVNDGPQQQQHQQQHHHQQQHGNGVGGGVGHGHSMQMGPSGGFGAGSHMAGGAGMGWGGGLHPPAPGPGGVGGSLHHLSSHLSGGLAHSSVHQGMMPGRPMVSTPSLTSAGSSSDPFSTLNAMALSAPVQPHPPQATRPTPAAPPSTQPGSSTGGSSSMFLAPPPRASTAVHPPAAAAAPPAATLDLLW